MHAIIRVSFVGISCLIGMVQSVLGQSVAYRPVALSGLTTVPISGGTFNGAFQGAINNSGNVVFAGNYGSNVYGIFGDFGSGIQAIARGDGPNLPGTGGTIQKLSTATLILNDANQFAFNANYGPTPSTNVGVFSNLSGNLAPLMLSNPGTAVPNVAATFTAIQGLPVMSSNSVAFYGVDTAFQSGLYRFTQSNGLTKIVRSNDAFPGAPPRVFTSPNSLITMNLQGVAAYIVGSQIPGTPPTNVLSHIYTSSPSQTTEVVRTGSIAPGTSLPFSNFGGSTKFVSIDQLNNIAFYGSYGTSGQQKGLFAYYNSTLIDIARSDGPTAPGTTGNFVWQSLSNASAVVMNNGHVLFKADTTSGPSGLWAYFNGSLSKVAHIQDTALDSGIVLTNIQEFALDGQGNVVFTNAVGSARSLFFVDVSTGIIRTLIRAGQSWDLDGLPGGTLKTVSGVFLGSSGIDSASGADGWPRVFNDNGQILVNIGFTDNSFGLYVISIPEPTTILLVIAPLCLALGYAIYKNRKHRLIQESNI